MAPRPQPLAGTKTEGASEEPSISVPAAGAPISRKATLIGSSKPVRIKVRKGASNTRITTYSK